MRNREKLSKKFQFCTFIMTLAMFCLLAGYAHKAAQLKAEEASKHGYNANDVAGHKFLEAHGYVPRKYSHGMEKQYAPAMIALYGH